MDMDIKQIKEKIQQETPLIQQLQNEISKVIVGQKQLIDRLLIALFCNQHVLLEGVPGLAKTLAVTTLAKTIQATFRRIQFTPDLLPADLTGTLIYNPKTSEFTPRKGPIFANIILADEINRAPAKVQSALLEAMQERQITIGDQTYPLDNPFLVLATQNPLEQQGTYQLPEAQVDRFMLKVLITYPTKEQEKLILQQQSDSTFQPNIQPVVELQDILRLRDLANEIYIDEKIQEYIVDLVHASRNPEQYENLEHLQPLIQCGASPRASIFLAVAAKAHAFLQGRAYVTPQDIKSIAPEVLRHRVIPTYEAEAQEITSDQIVQQILNQVQVP
ncbi:MAG: MoxR family ATPase [Planctomycetes bacterium]|jgi:MoxR-like ATPase|nr:MoxR family ATPase [Planctomycetota bacterium]HNZ66861.1 MoxR family ATPase [Planctomycetota bacterium]HON44302.1 MoxR family ATPase [Planctomycetota bacterium]HPY75867.1 MoxR family ATPase [Planctomycetota bacterium]HQB01448.1 MoxR family ATPase [Planctomycetota bacterium]